MTVTSGKHTFKKITGTLDQPGYTVMAFASDGRARVVRAHSQSFTISPPAKSVTLHLRAPDGKYAGPVVVGQEGGHAVTGVRAGTRLGTVTVHPTYARVAHRLPRSAVDGTRWARIRNGSPLGAGRFGRVRSKPPHHRPPGDRDADAVPDVIDIDDDGDLVIDNVDRSRAAAQSGRTSTENPPNWIKVLVGSGLSFSANANAPSLVDAISRVLPESGLIMVSTEPGDFVELDCGGAQQATPRAQGLLYCSPGGTGTVRRADGSEHPFPDDFDPDGNGLGNLTPWPTGDNTLILRHGATAEQIGTGDVLVQRVTNNGVQTQTTDTVQYVFATAPTLVSYDDGNGNATTIPYPVPAGGQGDSADNGFPVTAGRNGHVVVRLVFWRPQRTPIPPETAPWIDIGHLSYGVSIGYTGGTCPTTSVWAPSSTLSPTPENEPEGGVFTDEADDTAADPANMLSFTVDLTDCLASQGEVFAPHTTAHFGVSAYTCGQRRCTGNGDSTGPDEANQDLFVTRQ